MSQQNREASQYFVAETSRKKSPSSMEAGEKVVHIAARP